jgi:hypothetical protein
MRPPTCRRSSTISGPRPSRRASGPPTPDQNRQRPSGPNGLGQALTHLALLGVLAVARAGEQARDTMVQLAGAVDGLRRFRLRAIRDLRARRPRP